MDKHIKTSKNEKCKERKKRGAPAKPNASAIHKAQKLRRYYEVSYEQYISAEGVEKRRRRQKDKEWKQA